MKILVTGGTSTVGKHLQNILPSAKFIGSSDCDLVNYNETLDYLNDYKPDAVIHLAAKVGGIKANIDNPVMYYEDNILMNTNILKASYKTGCKRFIGLLSTCAYPDVVNTYPMTEDDFHIGPPAPSNFGYGYSKRALATQIDLYNKQYKTNYQYLIPSNLYSEYDTKPEGSSHYINALIHKIINAESLGHNHITLWGDGTPLRQCTYANDIARVINEVLEKNIYSSFNVSFPTNFSIHTIAKIALYSLGKRDWEIKYIHPDMNGQYRKDVSIDKMLEYLPDFNFTALNEGIKIVYNKIKNNNE
jgi:GDP-L-fucose synthase